MPIVTANVSTSTAPAYTSLGNSAVTFMSLCNYSGGNIVANVYVVPNGSSPGNLNIVMSNLPITSNDSYQFYAGNEKLILSNNDTIQVNASANSAVTIVTSYTPI